MSDKGNGNGQAGSSRRIYIIICFFLIIIVALVGVIAFLLGRNKGGSVEDPQNSNTQSGQTREVTNGSARLVVDQKSAADVMEDMRKEVEEGMFECKMSMTWNFPDGSSESSDAYVANSTNNKYPIYFDVTLNNTGEQIFSSPVIPVGAELSIFKLDKDLDSGSYEATVMYTLIRDEESQEPISSAGFIITINVNE